MAQEQIVQGTEYVTVEIYDQTYHLSGQDVRAHVRDLAARVDAKMRAVAAQGRTVDSLRVAVLAALNLADELVASRYRPIRNCKAMRAPRTCAACWMKCLRTRNSRPGLEQVPEPFWAAGSQKRRGKNVAHCACIAQDL
jgi:cell division protein ZapA (FtsZ GTPase activity inhibitor)